MKFLFCFITLLTGFKYQLSNNFQTSELVPGLFAYSDYEVGIENAKKMQKPALVYFRDRRSANCRKFETNIFSDSKIKDYLNKNYVVISLLVDDSNAPEKSRINSKTGEPFKTIAEYHLDIQMALFKMDSQPYTAILSKDSAFIKGSSYTSDPKEYLKFLKAGKGK